MLLALNVHLPFFTLIDAEGVTIVDVLLTEPMRLTLPITPSARLRLRVILMIPPAVSALYSAPA